MLQFNTTDVSLIGLAGILIGGLIGSRLALGRDVSLRWRKFRDECVSIQEDIVFWKLRRFNRAFTAYCNLKDEDIHNFDPRHVL